MRNNNLKHEIMWWLSRLTIMMTSLFLSFTLASSAYAIDAGDTIKFVNGDLPPHNVMVDGHPELSHGDLAFAAGDSFEVTFPDPGDYNFQCDPHAGAGMKGVIHVE